MTDKSKKQTDKIFVVQKHKGKRLHYDFRLEMDGVLKSWAVPKGPSMNPADKRLAVEVEDHDLVYAGYEGVIPDGMYGAGPVMVWDTGGYEDLKPGGIDQGRIEVELFGEKLKGKFAVVKMKGRGDKNWLFIKMKDGMEGDYDITQSAPDSVKTKRSLEEIEKEPPTSPPCEVKE
jgi:bifunctional non-homologous end joining protein LigD